MLRQHFGACCLESAEWTVLKGGKLGYILEERGMTGWLWRWFGGRRDSRGVRPAPEAPAGVFKTASRAEDLSGLERAMPGYLPLPNATPFVGILTSI